jgi:hypothetical protein
MDPLAQDTMVSLKEVVNDTYEDNLKNVMKNVMEELVIIKQRLQHITNKVELEQTYLIKSNKEYRLPEPNKTTSRKRSSSALTTFDGRKLLHLKELMEKKTATREDYVRAIQLSRDGLLPHFTGPLIAFPEHLAQLCLTDTECQKIDLQDFKVQLCLSHEINLSDPMLLNFVHLCLSRDIDELRSVLTVVKCHFLRNKKDISW